MVVQIIGITPLVMKFYKKKLEPVWTQPKQKKSRLNIMTTTAVVNRKLIKKALVQFNLEKRVQRFKGFEGLFRGGPLQPRDP